MRLANKRSCFLKFSGRSYPQ